MTTIISRAEVPSTNTPPPPGTRGALYRSGAWTPINEEVCATKNYQFPASSLSLQVVADSLEVIQGSIPKDLAGVYIRNTENPIHDSMDGNVNYHPFVSKREQRSPPPIIYALLAS